MEVAGDLISGKNVKIIEGYVVLNFEVAISSGFRDMHKHHFMTAAAKADIDESIKRNRIRCKIRITSDSLTLNCFVLSEAMV